MSKARIPAGAVVRGTDKGYVHGDIPLTPGQERPVEKVEETYPYMRPRDAATLILVRMKGKTPEVLMGCRDAKHAFMPNRYVFPGGRVDKADAHIPVATALDRHVKTRLLKAASLQRAQEFRGESCSPREFSHAAQSTGGGDRHNSGDYWHCHAGQFAAVAEIVKVAIVKKELRHDE